MPYPVKYYHGAMTGAPVMSGTAGATIGVLDAVLINGFNSQTFDSISITGNVATATKAAGSHGFLVDDIILVSVTAPTALNDEFQITAVTGTTVTFSTSGISNQSATGTITLKIAPVGGWSKAYTGTNKAVYKSTDGAASVGYIRIDDTDATKVQIRGFESMTDVDTGSNQMPSASWITANLTVTGLGLYKSSSADSTSRKWWLIADSRMIFFGVAGAASTPDLYGAAMMGDINSYKAGDVYAFTIAANNPGFPYDQTGMFSVHQVKGSAGFMPLLRNMSGTGTFGVCSRWSAASAGNLVPGNNSVISYPALSDSGVHLHKAYISDADTQANGLSQRRGDLPGIYFPEEYRPGTHLQKVTYNGKSMITLACLSANSGTVNVNAFFALDSWR